MGHWKAAARENSDSKAPSCSAFSDYRTCGMPAPRRSGDCISLWIQSAERRQQIPETASSEYRAAYLECLQHQ
jgi:hypothetical protein